MKNKFVMAGLLGLSMVFAACSSGSTDAKPDFTQGEQAAEAFKNAGYEVTELTTEADTCTFKVVSDNGGANVSVSRYSSGQEAEEAFSAGQATLSQSDYYIAGEDNSDDSMLTVFTNSINYNDAALALQRKDSTVIDVREIAQGQIQDILKILGSLGIETAGITLTE